MHLKAILLMLFAVGSLRAAVPEGIPRELAIQRARTVSKVAYRLQFLLVPQASNISGHEEIRFRLRAPKELLLDFREGSVNELRINGVHIAVQAEKGHILVPASRLRAGNNIV